MAKRHVGGGTPAAETAVGACPTCHVPPKNLSVTAEYKTRKNMCLYPRLILNRKYIPNKKNNYLAPEIKDKRTMYVPVGCTKCMECRKQKARQWQVRMTEEIRLHKRGEAHMVTLTISNEEYTKLSNEIKGLDGYDRDNEIATLAVRRFLERWRKQYKVSIKHWLVTELGHNGTENIHLHGILFTKNKDDIQTKWKYGYVFIGDYVNERTVNYCVKYITKLDLVHKTYQSKILTSPAMGSNYVNRIDATLNQYKEKKGTIKTDETYTTRTGIKLNLPIYYRNKIYTDEQREKLWLQKLDENIRWVNGQKANNDTLYFNLLKIAQQQNKRLGYGDNEKNWTLINYERERSNLNFKLRTKETEKINEQIFTDEENINNLSKQLKSLGTSPTNG